jgi:predicted translin family RNA/ssDNA-binding protein
VDAQGSELHTYKQKDQQDRYKEAKKYPLDKPSFSDGDDWKIAPIRYILGLRDFAGVRGEINRHIMQNLHVSYHDARHHYMPPHSSFLLTG